MSDSPDLKVAPVSDADVQTLEERFVAARALYEGTPGMTIRLLSQQTGIGEASLKRRSNAEGWRKNYPHLLLKPGEMTEAAQRAADLFRQKVEDLGPEVSADKPLADQVTAEQREAVVQQTVSDFAVDERGRILARHRTEWAAPRALSAEAVALRKADPVAAFERAKMAKITAETLKLVQDGERKAWGIDAGDVPPGHVVVIERA